MPTRLRWSFAASFLLLAIVASPLAASATIVPPGPTSTTPFEVHVAVTCPVASHTVDRTGNVLKVTLEIGGLCFDPPTDTVYAVLVAPLPPGEYRVDVMVLDSVLATTTFIVRNGGEKPPFEIHPFAVRIVQDLVRMRIEATGPLAICATPDCSDTKVIVGGVEAQDLKLDLQGVVWFTAPPHAPGLVDVTVQKQNPVRTWVSPAALYYFDGDGRPDPSVFERILFPVLFSTDGANGSQWVSEAAISNPNPWYLDTFNSVEPIVCLVFPCGERIAPGHYSRFNGQNHPHGVGFAVPREEADSLAFALRVRDVSRAAEGLGSEVPVVREKDMFVNKVLTLLDVPLDPRYRVKLRVYAFDPFFGNAGLGAGLTTINTRTAARNERGIPMEQACTGPGCATVPAYGEIDLQPGVAEDRVNLYIVTPQESLSWAFATVTNNDTQQVTIITPDGKGGIPCRQPCEEPR